MKRKLFFILFIICVGITFKKYDRIEKYFIEREYYKVLQKAHLIKRCYQPLQDFDEIFAQENINYELADKEATENSFNKLNNLSQNSALKIPPITHHIYFSDNSKQLNDFYLEKMKANYDRLNALSLEWQHFIWTNKPEIFSDEVKNMKGVKVALVDELQDHILYETLIKSIANGVQSKSYYAEGSDLLRIMALEKFGGIYNDMDYEIYNAARLFELIKNFDFIGGRETSQRKSFYGNSFFAAKSNHPILQEMIRLRNIDNQQSPDYIMYPCYTNDMIYFNGPPLLTIAYFKQNNIDGNNDVILPSRMIFNTEFARLKNNTCHYNEITKEDFILSNNNLDDSNDIIGADMFCGNWYDNKNNKKLDFIWNIP